MCTAVHAASAGPSCAPVLLGNTGGPPYRLAHGDGEVFVFMTDGGVLRYAVDAASRLDEISRSRLPAPPPKTTYRVVVDTGVYGDRLWVIEEISNTTGLVRTEIRVTVYDISSPALVIESSRSFPALKAGEFLPARARTDGELLVIARDRSFEFYGLGSLPDSAPVFVYPEFQSSVDFAIADGLVVYSNYGDEKLLDARDVLTGGSVRLAASFDAELTEDFVSRNGRLYYFSDFPPHRRPASVLDITDPVSPEPIGTFGPGTLFALAFGDDTTAVLRTPDDDDTRRVLDIYPGIAPNDAEPTGSLCLDCVSLRGSEFFDRDSVAVAGDTVIIESKGLLSVDISDPSRPEIVERLHGSDFGLAVQTDGDLAYTANSGSGWSVWDIADPTRPVAIRTVVTPDNATGLYLDGSTLYVTVSSAGVEIYGVSDSRSPVRIGGFPTIGSASDLLPIPGGLAVATNEGLEFFSGDPGSGFEPKSVVNTGDNTLARDLVWNDGLVLAASVYDGLLIVDATEFDDPELLASIRPDGLGFCEGIAVKDSTAYLASWTGIGVVDVSDPTDPLSRGVHEGAVRTNKLTAVGDLLYATGLYNPLSVYSIENPQEPRLVWSAESDPSTPETRFVQAVEHWIEGDRVVVNEGTTNRTVGRGLTIWELPEMCDIPCSDADLASPLGVLDPDDVVAFVDLFSGQSVRTDYSSPFGVWDLTDLVVFLEAFAAGCP